MTIAAFASPSTSSDESSSTARFDYDYESQNQSQSKEDLPARGLDEVTVTIGCPLFKFQRSCPPQTCLH